MSEGIFHRILSAGEVNHTSVLAGIKIKHISVK
jgi:hypothetical protein